MSSDRFSRAFLQSLAQPPETPEQKAAREHEVFVRIAVDNIKSAIIETAKKGQTSYIVHVTSTPEPDQHSLDPSLFNDVFLILQQDFGNVSCSESDGCIHFDWS